MHQVNLIVTCTKRKTLEAEPYLQIRSLKGFSVQGAFERWIDRLENADVEGIPARHLYAGDHWSVVRSIADAFSDNRRRINVWVCSAGYGMVPIDATLKPYSATFSSAHPDSIAKWRNAASGVTNSRLWWQLMSTWSGPDHKEPRSVSDVAKTYPNDPLVVVASRVYLSAISDDLRNGREYLSSPDLLSIVSAGTNSLVGDCLQQNLLPCDARLQQVVGGALQSLNIRIVREIMQKSELTSLGYRSIGDWLKDVAERQPAVLKMNRRRLTDHEVKEYIQHQLDEDSVATCSHMLRRLRNEGLGCEQSRFSKLFSVVRKSSPA